MQYLFLIEITTEQIYLVAGGAIGAIVTIGAVVHAIRSIRSGIWNPFNKGWLAPRRARRLKLASVAESFDELVARTKRIEAEVTPNGGKSLKDTINRIDRGFEHLQARARHDDNNSDRCKFELDERGSLIFANVTLCETLEASEEDLHFRNWISRVTESQRQFVLQELRAAVENKMTLNFVARFDVEKGYVLLRVQAQPYVRPGGELVGFFGTAFELEK